MFKVSYKEVTDEDPEDVVWNNMKKADHMLNQKFMLMTIVGWFRLHPDKNYQDLELEFRKRDMDTHIIAREVKLKPTVRLSILGKHDKREYKYEGMLSCRPKEYAMKEVLSFYDTYEENFDRLPETGILMTTNENIDLLREVTEEDLACVEHDDIDKSNLIQYNKVMINYVNMTVDEFLKEETERIMERYGIEPTKTIVGINGMGLPIYGFVLGDTIVSSYGYCSFAVKDGRMIKTIICLDE
jgi:hypothetical protein